MERDLGTPIPFSEEACLGSFRQTVDFAMSGPDDPWVAEAELRAAELCGALFDALSEADDPVAHLTMLGFLAIDISYNVAHTLDRAALRYDLGGVDEFGADGRTEEGDGDGAV